MAGEPYCGNCGYTLIGLVDSSRCPECGRPLVEVLQRRGAPMLRGRRYRSDITIFGAPLLHVALGPDGDEPSGQARGIIAIGDTAYGCLAIGGRAIGLAAIGGVSVGVVSIGGCALGLLAGLGGFASGLLAAGGGVVGGVVAGGGGIGYIVDAGGAMAYYGRGGGIWGRYAIDFARRDPQAIEMFASLQWLFGRPVFGAPLAFTAWVVLLMSAFAAAVALVVFARYYFDRRHASA